jgi:hypothetical protein
VGSGVQVGEYNTEEANKERLMPEVMFETNRLYIQMLGEQAIHFRAAAEATRGDSGRDLAGFVRAYDAARAVNVALDEMMREVDKWSLDARKASGILMDEMVDWVINLHHELDLVDSYDLEVPDDLAIERTAFRVEVEADADPLLLLGNAAAMFAWSLSQHGLLRIARAARDRENRFEQFAWCHSEFERTYRAVRERIEAGNIAEESVVTATAKYLAESAEALRSDVVNISELPAGAGV